MEFQILPPVQMVVEGGEFNNASHPFQHFIRSRCEFLPEQFNAPLCWFPEVGQHFHNCGLTGTVRSQETIDFAFLNMHGHIGYKIFAANGFCKLIRL